MAKRKALRAYTQAYGPKGWRELVIGHASNLDGPTLCVAVRRTPTTDSEASALLGAMTQAGLRSIYAAALKARRAHERAAYAAARARPQRTPPDRAAFPEWTIGGAL